MNRKTIFKNISIITLVATITTLTSTFGAFKSVNALETAFMPSGTVTAGDYTVISNESTDTTIKQSTGTISFKNVQAQLNNIDTDNKPYKIDVNRPVDLEYITESELYSQIYNYNFEPSAVYAVGDTRVFNTYNFATGADEKTTTKLLYSGVKCNVWVGDSKITATAAKSLGEEFDNKIYNLVVNNFGNVSDVDRDGKVNLVCYDIKDGFNGTGGYIGGYFFGGDLVSNTQLAVSNQCEMLNIDTMPSMYYGTSTIDLTGANETIAHELQHLVNFVQNAGVEKGVEMPDWINEGLSEAATQIYTGKADLNRIDYYNRSTSIANGHSLLEWESDGDVLSNYSLSYLFFQYLRIQCGRGNTIYKEISQNINNNEKAVEAVIQKYISPTLTFNQFMTNFRMALLRKDLTGAYGFKGEAGFEKINTPIYTSTTNKLDLKAGGAIVVKANDDYAVTVPSDKGANVKYLGKYDVYQKEDVNMDFKVDVLDLTKVASNYNKVTTKTNWYNDQNKDKIFDIYDFTRISKKIK